jgi:tripartite-type tricarboxylate transporter receptor subunit TctC
MRSYARASILPSLVVFACGSHLPAHAADSANPVFPHRPVRIVVPIAPGGATDSLARVLADRLSKQWKQTVFVENKAGAAAMIGTEYVMKSAADGYTLLLTNDGPITINPSLYKKNTLDPLRELTPISNLASLPLVAVVHPSVPAKSIADLINLARSRPGTLNYGSGGSTSRMGAELFKSMVGLDMVHVPYKGSGQMVVGLVGNEVQLAFDGISSSIPLIKSGKVRALAVTGPTRSTSLPDIPTVDEAGVKGYQTTTWLALFGPKAMPVQLREQLATDFKAALQDSDVRARMTSLGLDPIGSTPNQFAEQLQTESKKWKELINKAGITGEE